MAKNIIVLLAFFSLLLIGCKDKGVEVDETVIPDKDVSYATHIQPVLDYHCTPCHNEQTSENGLRLTSWANTTADPAIVFPYEPDNSKLVWAIEGRAGIAFMPPVGSPYKPLNQNQIDGIKTWIREGAKSN